MLKSAFIKPIKWNGQLQVCDLLIFDLIWSQALGHRSPCSCIATTPYIHLQFVLWKEFWMYYSESFFSQFLKFWWKFTQIFIYFFCLFNKKWLVIRSFCQIYFILDFGATAWQTFLSFSILSLVELTVRPYCSLLVLMYYIGTLKFILHVLVPFFIFPIPHQTYSN